MHTKTWFHRPLQVFAHIAALFLGVLLLSQLRPATAATATVPILLVVNDTAPNKFGRYVGEILRAEGLNAYAVAQLGAVTANDLSGYRLVVLAETPLTSAQAGLLNSYVNGGGRLLALRPDAQLAALFGLAPAGGVQTDGYLKIDSGQPVGQGLPTETLQIHGEADRYTLSGATAIATLYSDAVTATAYPEVVASAAGQGRTDDLTYMMDRKLALYYSNNPA